MNGQHLKLSGRNARRRLCLPIVEAEIRRFRQQLFPPLKVDFKVFCFQAVRVVDVATDLLALLVLVANKENALYDERRNVTNA